MKFFKCFGVKILFVLLAVQGIAKEEMAPLPSAILISDEIMPLSASPASKMANKTILYGSLSLVPGGGISVRERRGLKGTAVDYKVGVIPFVFDTVSFFPVLSADYNFLSFTKDGETSPYFSYGIGAAYIVPYIPLRAGIEFKHGFIDVGAKLVMGFIPSPEIRAGVDLKF